MVQHYVEQVADRHHLVLDSVSDLFTQNRLSFWPKPNINIAVTRGNLSNEIVHAAAKTSDFWKVFAKYIAIETDFAANFCDTCLPYIH